MALTIGLVLLVATLARGQECPCVHREADPLFPGAEGSRWDCEYVSHGLTAVPKQCWSAHPEATQVFLSYNAISRVDADSFAGLTNLQVLSLSHNKIAVVEAGALKGLETLKYLDLSSNKLNEPPADVWDLTDLLTLDMADNSLTEVQHYNISNLVNLEVLDLHLNHLSQIPYHSLENLANLRQLHLYWNQLVVLPVLTQNLQLEEVLVNGNAVLDFPQDMFGHLTKPLTYHFVDNPTYDVHGGMLLPLPDHSHIVMDPDVSVWAADQTMAQQLLNKTWVIRDGLARPIDLSALIQVCGAEDMPEGRMPPC